ncbi:CCA tRNA nucleotidyltransferase [Peptoniphilus sp. oral taxon 386]|uniref:CCA tRNA nucleotidyltransferase n=1 Tax=Peptoniphilus sp. oral taxon 386 TaxID=652713 RepID=UPI0001DA9A40|nr:HD domain-containing protein [Peptoniphilus sp. oral taxon 386]EFI41882.1 HDIG domain protein [Peptoniphilus sp. oral taxon 386 str. F0131]
MPTEILEILNILNMRGHLGYIVGGSLRDMLLDRIPFDFDIATDAKPYEIEEIFEDYLFYSIGKKYGTITIKYKDYIVELTTFRKEGIYENHRYPTEVFFTENIEEDLKRRDFTINAMAMDGNGNIIDLYSGISDIKSRVIRTVGNADDRICEDALRILRAIRFAGTLDFKLDCDLKDAIIKNRSLLNNISKERIASEFNKILLSEMPSKSLKLMADTKVLDIIYPKLYNTVGYNQKTPYHNKTLFEHLLCVVDNVPKNFELRLAALFHDIAKPSTLSVDKNGIGHFYGHAELGAKMAEEILRENRYSNSTIKKVSTLILYHMKVHDNMTDKALRRQIRKVGAENILELYELMIADRFCTMTNRDTKFLLDRKNRITELLKESTSKEKFLAVNGRDIMTLGFKEGKIIGEILEYITEVVLDDPSLNNREELEKIIIEKYGR